MRALTGLSEVSFGGGILVMIAFRISVIPIPSYKQINTRLSNLHFSLKRTWDIILCPTNNYNFL